MSSAYEVSKFEVDVEHLQELTCLRLFGTIDEDSELGPLTGRVRGRVLLLELSGIRAINNCGVRDWVRWIQRVQRKATVILAECSPVIVQKLNQVANFAGRGFVRSFYIPYFCATCNTEQALLVDVDALIEGEPRAPTCRCDSCDGVMQFDDLEGAYFAFLHRSQRSLPSDLEALLDEQLPKAARPRILALNEGSTFAGLGRSEAHPAGEIESITANPMTSAAALRRLRDKTGLRQLRRPTEGAAAHEVRGKIKHLGWLAIAALLLGALLTFVLIL